jgi:hypothetical protein
MKRIILIGLVFILTGKINVLIGQTEKILTESQRHIFWQPDRVLTERDFQGDGTQNPKFVKYCDELDLCVVASTGVFAVLDIPKKKRKRGELIEKAYFAPAFEKSTSFIIKLDSTGIAKQKVVFDIFEVSARFARQQLQHLQDSVGGYGIISIMFKSVEARAIEMRTSLVDSYTKDVYIDKKEGAYEIWRERVDKLLAESKEFATKPEDCYRFVKNASIDENYEMAKTVIGNLYK